MKVSRREFIKDSAVAGMTPLLFQKGAASSAPLETSAPVEVRTQTPEGLPRMEVRDFTRDFDPAYLSNGLIGIRPGPNALSRADTFVSGFVCAHELYEVESLSQAPCPLETDIRINGMSVLKNPELLSIKRQVLDMACGELITDMVFSPGNGLTLDVRVLQFASRSIPSVLCQEIQVITSADAEMEFIPTIDGIDVSGRIYRSQPPAGTKIDLFMGIESRGGLSKLGVALLLLSPDGAVRKQDLLPTATGISRSCFAQAKGGRSFRFQTIAAMVSELYQPEPTLEAVRVAKWAGVLGIDGLRKKNRQAWSDLWQSRVRIIGDTDAQKVLDAAFFYLHSSVHDSTQTGMAPFGFSQAAHYYGHSFWDTETWSLLPIILSSPSTARALVEYRVRGLGVAKQRAALFGFRGAQFPWEAAPTSGFDVTPAWASSGWLEQHVTPDIALGVWEYQLATNDKCFLREGTWPVLQAAAEWIESRGTLTGRGFEIEHNMNPSEKGPDASNNSYMNLVCKMAVAAAIQCAEMVGVPVPGSWVKVRDRIVLPIDRVTGVVLPSDQPPSLLSKDYPITQMDFLTVHDTPLPLRVLRNTFDYEESLSASSRVLTGFVRASMAATAAFLGDRRRAASLFEQSWKQFWLEPFGMAREMPTQNYGCFLTNYGSILQTAMLGFTGIRITNGDWRKYPASLPEGWSRIEIDRVWVKGEPKRLVARDGVSAELFEG